MTKTILTLFLAVVVFSGCSSSPSKTNAMPVSQGTATGYFCWVTRPQVIGVTMYVAVDGVEAATGGKNEVVKFTFPAGNRKIKAGVKAKLGALLAKKTISGDFNPDQTYYFIWTDQWRPGAGAGGYVDMFLYKVSKEDFESLTKTPPANIFSSGKQ